MLPPRLIKKRKYRLNKLLEKDLHHINQLIFTFTKTTKLLKNEIYPLFFLFVLSNNTFKSNYPRIRGTRLTPTVKKILCWSYIRRTKKLNFNIDYQLSINRFISIYNISLTNIINTKIIILNIHKKLSVE